MLHGSPAEPAQQAGFAAMTLARYVETAASEVPIYRVNPAFEAGSLSEPELLYERLVRP
jgi:hypothetical protein